MLSVHAHPDRLSVFLRKRECHLLTPRKCERIENDLVSALVITGHDDVNVLERQRVSQSPLTRRVEIHVIEWQYPPRGAAEKSSGSEVSVGRDAVGGR